MDFVTTAVELSLWSRILSIHPKSVSKMTINEISAKVNEFMGKIGNQNSDYDFQSLINDLKNVYKDGSKSQVSSKLKESLDNIMHLKGGERIIDALSHLASIVAESEADQPVRMRGGNDCSQRYKLVISGNVDISTGSSPISENRPQQQFARNVCGRSTPKARVPASPSP